MSNTTRLREVTVALAGVLAEWGFTRLQLIAHGVSREVLARVADLPREIESLATRGEVTLAVYGVDLRITLRGDGSTSIEGSAPQRVDIHRALGAIGT